jgi:hypothetical protein
MNGKKPIIVTLLLVVLLLPFGAKSGLAEELPPVGVQSLEPLVGTAFTYQGQLNRDGTSVDDTCDLQFSLWDASTAGTQLGSTLSKSGIAVSRGLFTVQLDFGANAFQGDARWLAITVRCPASTGTYVALTPRQAIAPSPYALALPGLYTQQNTTSPNLIGGYSGNWVTPGVYGATIGGGGSLEYPNRVTDRGGTVGGGVGNRAGDNAGTVQDAINTTVGGGAYNTASATDATIGGGANNTAGGWHATVGGGKSNTASGIDATIAGGVANTAGTWGATVSGGITNTASAILATVAGGRENTASGDYATVAGGGYNFAQGHYSFAAGHRAKANAHGCFVWGDFTDRDIVCNDANRWVARAYGGVYFYTGEIPGFLRPVPTGARLPAGESAWEYVSARELKENFAPVDTYLLLDRLALIDISTWNYRGQDGTALHIGPVANEFNALVDGLGGGQDHINSLDADGVALAAIQGLYQLSQEQAMRISELEARLAALEQGQTAPVAGSTADLVLPGLAVALVVAGTVWVTQRKDGLR